jgi:hypothetical protein
MIREAQTVDAEVAFLTPETPEPPRNGALNAELNQSRRSPEPQTGGAVAQLTGSPIAFDIFQ